MAAYLYIPHGNSSIFSVESYVEALAAGHAQDSPNLPEPVADEL
jgi:hypothetical protein